MNKTVSQGDEIEILYSAKLKDGSVFDTTDTKNPFKFIVGTKDILPEINNSVIGMLVGDKKTLELTPEKAYGAYNEKLLVKIPLDKIPKDAQMGDILNDSEGNRWWVRKVEGDFAILDGNHPLAGQDLIFEIELVKIS
jgi:peptidylprolyl isomerase